MMRDVLSSPKHVNPHYWYQQVRKRQDQNQVISYIIEQHDLHNLHSPKIQLILIKLTLAKNDYIECQTSIFSAPGASNL
jgi:hypothetical protein